MDIINHIRHLLFGNTFLFNRKRRAVDDFENPVTNKIRRISTSQMSSPEDDWLSISSSNSLRKRSGLLPRKITPTRHRTSWLKDNPITVSDDDEDVIEVKKPTEFDFLRKPPLKNTSTPNYNLVKNGRNGDEDVTFVKYVSPDEKKLLAKKRGFDYIKPNVSLQNGHSNSASSHANRLTNGTRKKDTPVLFNFSNGKCTSSSSKKTTPTSAIEHSFRLDEKRKYKELLNKAAPNSSMKSLFDSFTEYSTPIGKVFPFGVGSSSISASRGKRIVDMALKSNEKKMNNFIDLTATNGKSKTRDFVDITGNDKRKSSSTCDTIKKVLNDMDSDVVVKDSDSEVEILPTPPSPKADFQVAKCNSLKTFIHPSEPTHDKWFHNEIKKHDEVIERTRKLIEEQQLDVEKLNTINDELRVKFLRDKVSKCLHIKELIVPDETKDLEAFPELSLKDEAIISTALDQRQQHSEILSSKFNMNITRADLLTLAGLNWLNDEVINFYMNLIIERGKKNNWPSVYAMNTFFYPKIISGGQSSVKRWTRRVDIFSYDLIAVPVHLRMHWCMAIIDFRKKRITYYDSMGGTNMECLRALKLYLEQEHLDKKKCGYDVSDWRLMNAKDIPQQMNGSDCGMFSCTFAEVLARDGEINFSQENMPYLRRKMVLEILEGSLLIS